MKTIKIFFLSLCHSISLSIYSMNIDSVTVSCVDDNPVSYTFKIRNNSNDILYVFDSYMKECEDGCFYESKYLHRYEKKTDTYKLSLLPILSNISSIGSGVMHQGFKRILFSGEIFYSFTEIAPFSEIEIKLKKKAFLSDVYTKEYSSNGYVYLKQKCKQYKIKPSSVTVEFAIYKNTDMLRKTMIDSDFDYKKWFIEQNLYKTISVIVYIPMISTPKK